MSQTASSTTCEHGLVLLTRRTGVGTWVYDLCSFPFFSFFYNENPFFLTSLKPSPTNFLGVVVTSVLWFMFACCGYHVELELS
ncbi:hypothetical protein OWV82_010639 [Melia azedarach]|uniref:Uncharacterized protein n=1 Tax=Melia azedarach TaxID=155640 RepID=A0ACC1Y736_MELAZ|nr:hypothetical protein OWV82_010639 [Melia azedarach]